MYKNRSFNTIKEQAVGYESLTNYPNNVVQLTLPKPLARNTNENNNKNQKDQRISAEPFGYESVTEYQDYIDQHELPPALPTRFPIKPIIPKYTPYTRR